MIIGLFTDTYEPDINGVATAVKTLKSVLEENHNRVIVVTTGLPGQRNVTFENDVMRIPGITLNFLYGYRMSSIYSNKAFNILRKIPFDVIHVQQEFGVSMFGRLCANRLMVPLVYTYHTLYQEYTENVTHGNKVTDHIAKKTIRYWTKIIASSRNEIITPSYKSQRILKEIGIENYIHVIPTAMDFKIYEQPKNAEKEKAFREKYHLEHSPILLYLGRLAFEKNVSELIEGFNAYKIRYRDKNSVLLIVGDGPYAKRLRQEREASPFRDQILFLGKVPHEDTLFYYQISDMFLCGSTTETQGLTYCEAIVSKTPVLAKYDFNLENLIQDGVTGFLYDSSDLLPDKIHEILTLPQEKRDRITAQARERCTQLYSSQTYYERMMHVYEKAIRRSF